MMIPLIELLLCTAHTLTRKHSTLGFNLCLTNKETEAHSHSLSKNSRTQIQMLAQLSYSPKILRALQNVWLP